MAHLFSRMLAALALCATFTTHAAPGDLDTTFGSGSGKVITAIGTGAGTLTAVTLQPDGKIVAAGGCSSTYDFCLARYLPNGALDTTFNTTGTVITAIVASADFARALALQPDGKIVVAGTCHNGNNFDFCLARYLPSGALDTTFNTTGTVITVIGSGNDDAYALALQPDGKIVVAGSCYNGSNYDFCLARYLPGGALDLSFNTTGKVVTAIGSSDDHAFALALQPDGKIVAAGFCINSNEDFCLARYLPGGALDTTFNTTGKVITAIGAGHDRLVALALQPDGKIVTAGACHNASDYGFCLARHHASGALDTNLNTTGKVITDVGARGSLASALALQPDGKIVVAGYCDGSSSRDFCVARYEGGPFDARNCSMDVDGDNQTFATTDGLIAARVMLGLTGNAVIGGITFASHATRTTWPAIRDYLVTQCGMSIVP